jgi:RNA polymerase primary sigma factor
MRILIAEDDRIPRCVLERTLQGWGHEVLTTCDGLAAWEVLQGDDAPKLAILDWMMPGLDGPQVCRKVRGLARREPTYCILLTARNAKADVAAGLGMQDLIAEGNMGLVRAVEAFDPSMDVRFSTYASYWIKQSIKRVIINSGKTIRLPAYTVELLSKWRRATAKLQEELGRAPTPEEIAAQLKLSKRQFHIVKMAINVQNAGAQEEEDRSVHETLTDHRCATPDAALALSDDLGKVLALLDNMDPRDAAVLRLRFGLSGEDPKTLKEIGDRLSLTRERVRQIERNALDQLREGLETA